MPASAATGVARSRGLQNHASDIAAMDLFVVPTIDFCSMFSSSSVWTAGTWCGSMSQQTLRLNRSPPTNRAFPWDEAPRYLIRDRDWIHRAVIRRRLRIMGIQDKPTAPSSPWQNGFAERLIGSIRRGCEDHFIVKGEAHLHRTLRAYAGYYNDIRTYRSLDKDAPVSRRVQRIGNIKSPPIIGGFITIMFGFRFSLHTGLLG